MDEWEDVFKVGGKVGVEFFYFHKKSQLLYIQNKNIKKRCFLHHPLIHAIHHSPPPPLHGVFDDRIYLFIIYNRNFVQ